MSKKCPKCPFCKNELFYMDKDMNGKYYRCDYCHNAEYFTHFQSKKSYLVQEDKTDNILKHVEVRL